MEGRILEGAIQGFARRYYEVYTGQVRVARRGDVSQNAKDCYVASGFFVGLFYVSVEEFHFLSQDLFHCERLVQLAVCYAKEERRCTFCSVFERWLRGISWEGRIIAVVGRQLLCQLSCYFTYYRVGGHFGSFVFNGCNVGTDGVGAVRFLGD